MLQVKLKGTETILADLNAIPLSLDSKMDRFCNRLCEIGANTARVYFGGVTIPELEKASNSSVEHHPTIDVTVEPLDNGYMVLASGDEICFVEFGAGVHYNSSDNYPGGRLHGYMAGIGEYGKGHGKQDAWYFNRGGETYRTHGNPPTPGMYFASEEMLQQITKIAKEVFG